MTAEEKRKHADYQRAWRAKNPERAKVISHAHYYRHLERNRERGRWNMTRILHGITRDEFERMYATQNGQCAICGCKQEGGQINRRRLHIDHDHETGKIRELLCGNCNLLIAYANENKAILHSALKYLDKWKL